MATVKIYLYPVWIRIWHVINALIFLLLIFTGIALHFSGSNFSLLSFESAVGIHNVTAIIVTFNYGIFLIGNMVTKNGKFYRKWRKNLAVNLWKQFVFYAVGIFKKEKHPFPINEQHKFNPLQKFAYVIVMYFGMPVLILSGIALLFPEMIAYTVFNISGMVFYVVLHMIVGFVMSLFLLVHIYTCTLGDKPGTLFKSMINGYHEDHG